MMKIAKISFLALLSVSVIVSCRKIEERPVEPGILLDDFNSTLSNCSNQIMDGSETGIDCGGPCLSCEQLQAGCELNLSNNQITYQNTTRYPSVACGPIGGEYRVNGTWTTGGSGSLRFFWATMPVAGRYQTISGTPQAGTNKVRVEMTIPSFNYTVSVPNKEVVVKRNGNQIILTFCDISLSDGGFSNISLQGKLTCM